MEEAQGSTLSDAVQLFNAQEFFACHDILEEIWSETIGPEREFYQGLIHAAVALFHFSEGNLTGARKMYGSAIRYLRPFQPVHRRVDIERLIQDLRNCFQELLEYRESYPEGISIREEWIPLLHYHATDR